MMKVVNTDVSANIEAIVEMDRQLAQTVLEQASELDDPKEVARAEKEMARAEKELDKGRPDKAIKHYKRAWEHAQKALE